MTGVIHTIDSESQAVEIQWTSGGHSTIPLQSLGLLSVDDVWKGAQVASIDLTAVGLPTPLIVLEPEYIIDVTEIANAWAGHSPAPRTSLLHRLRAVTTTQAMLSGTLLNTVFDLLAAHPERSDVEILESAARGRSLSLAALANQGISITDIIDRASTFLPAMRSALDQWRSADVTVEPYVISPLLGFQGRFDILVTGSSTTEIIEMKGGSPPRSGVRPSHLVQASAYALLHVMTTGSLPDQTCLWYVTDVRTPFRKVSADSILNIASDIVRTRNVLVAQDRAIAHRRFEHLREVDASMPGTSSFDREDAHRFAESYRLIDRLSRTVFQAWMSFIHAERWEQRMGEHGARARAALWRQSSTDKADDPACVTGLRLDESRSDLESMRLVLTTHHISDCSLRPGDLVVLHVEDTTRVGALQILKGTLDAIDDQEVVVTLRNKQAALSQLQHSTWTLETDVADGSLTSVLPSLNAFLEARADRRDVLLGRTRPRFDEPKPLADSDLTSEQRMIVQRALSARDYLLIQGPPGTGKTSRLLRSIIRGLLEDPSERVLVLAYTNRAVSEICRVLDAALPPGSYLRHGSSTGVAGTDPGNAIPSLGRTMDPSELGDRIAQCRCIVATVSSMHSGRDILAFGDFTTTVIDEASQILEPYLIGPLLHSQRSILIGDHFQLPPVVALPPAQLHLSAPLLEEIGCTDLGMTTFERLHRRCTAMQWTEPLATLTRQGRMHRDVMAFPSMAFYDGMLRTAEPWQEDDSPLPWHDTLPSRAAFVPVTGSPQTAAEVQTIVDLITAVDAAAREAGHEISIGVITPFRVQNREISLALPVSVRHRVTVDTVERFQGSQRDVIFFGASVGSSVELRNIRSDVEVEGRSVDRKFNVACTRAREQFVLVGHPEVLKGAPAYANALSVLTWVYGH